MKNKEYRLRGMTLVEVIVATAISAFVLAGLFSALGGIYFSQKKITANQQFASETRFLMERAVQLVRNNTLDYDRFFVEVGPDVVLCSSFDEDQVSGSTLPSERVNERENRERLGYSAIFFWNVLGNNGASQIRNLGGKKLGENPGDDDVLDDCGEAWSGDLSELYLINRERTQRSAMRLNPDGSGRLQIQRMLGADTNNDREIDAWGIASTWVSGSSECDLFEDEAKLNYIGSAYGVASEKECVDIYDWVSVSPSAIEVEEFEFIPTPSRDPYLNYRVDEAQVHPQAFIRLKTRLRNPADYGMGADAEIDMTLQTTASSRVFGNPRE